MPTQCFPLVPLLFVVALFTTGCSGNSDSNAPDTDSTTDSDNSSESATAGQVDLLVIVDNSRTMPEEHLLLSPSLTALAETLSASVESLRVAVITSDMGLQWNGNAPDTDAIDAGEKC